MSVSVKNLSSSSGKAPAGYLRPCAVCGRTFSEDRIATHQKICRKVKTNEKRRRRREVALEKPPPNKKKPARPLARSKAKPSETSRNWEKKSNQLRSMLRRAKLVSKYEKEGNEFKLMEIAQQTSAAIEDDFLPCKTCGRTFAPSALKRHAPICKNLRSARPKGLGRFQGKEWAQRSTKARPKRPAAKRGVGLYGKSTFGRWREDTDAQGVGGGGIRATNETSANNPMVF